MMTVALTEKGTAYAEAALQVKDLFNPQQPWAAYVTNAIKARELFAKDKAYIVKDGEALIIDEFSGRVMAGRRWGDGLHQAIEAKEGLTVQAETEVIASITYQSLFRRYAKLSAMSGTALTEAEEFSTIYGLSVVAVPPVLPRQRVDLPNAVYKSVKGKSSAALNELMGMHRSGRPVLVGTTSVDASQAFSDKLTALGVKHEVLNAKPESIAREAEIIAQAGRKGAVTIATNMAGRGTDILLGGSPSAMARLRVREALAAAAGIAVPPVSPDFYPCALDEDTLGWIADAAKAYSLDEKLAVAASAAAVEEGSVEDLAREAFEAVRQAFDEVLSPERQEVAELGGLHVIGTNLHESRRIDDQLRGRSGRQGDPGSTHFFLSLEDRIFRLFGADKVKGVLDFLRVAEDQPLESEKVTETVQSVQDGVERYYYELRKGLFDFDEVIAAQREAVYAQRDRALRTDAAATLKALHVATAAVVRDIFEANWKGRASADGALAMTLATKLGQFFPALATLDGLEGKQRAEAEAIATTAAAAALDAKVAQLDGVRAGLAYESARYLTLLQTDNLWKAHMKAMNFVKDFAGLKVYNQQKPIDVYREEGLRLYERMQVAMRQNVVFSFFAYKPR
ncbi:preprotein translocase subunit [Chrysochromulina tobinii]|uniref:Preprotein translocase subunit n=1 Tax=Chrysochromulina tobinii TaxID=1460289 RepID=A0A0M0K0W6_9EUKA|nr:preprotein translocase subunit [Chrysochromulina tobinii]|eukprot:KOO32252.1 preprotein translocase subunit [Chrysochromulina sp. CCMP291]